MSDLLRETALGAFMQTFEAATLGLPFEVWKTRQAANSQEGAWQSLQSIYYGKPKPGSTAPSKPAGLGNFYVGMGAKVAEASSKGAVLLLGKALTEKACGVAGYERNHWFTSAAAGFGGGVSQTVVMAPLTLVVTYKVEGGEAAKHRGTLSVLREMGLKNCYASSGPIALRQGSNWMLRAFFTNRVLVGCRWARGKDKPIPISEAATALPKSAVLNPSTQGAPAAVLAVGAPVKTRLPPLGVAEQIFCGVAGGCLSCINQPFEVLRVVMQSDASLGRPFRSTGQLAKEIFAASGVRGFYVGLIPRFFLAGYQTVCMITLSDLAREAMQGKLLH